MNVWKKLVFDLMDLMQKEYAMDYNENHDERGRFTFATGNGIVQYMENENKNVESRFDVPRTLSAMAKQFYVSSPKDMREEQWKLKEGSTVTGIKAMATGNNIRDVDRLVNEYKKSNGDFTKADDWIKVRGTAIVTDGITDKKAEVHWYQCKYIGKVEFKVKRWYDED